MMTSKDKKNSELHILNAWCHTVVNFIVETDASSAPLVSQFKGVISASFQKQNLKGMKTLKRDLSDMIEDLKPDKRAELNNLLEPSLGMTLEDADVLASNLISEGSINSDDEYRFLTTYIDRLIDAGANAKIAEINLILSKFVEGKMQ